MNRFTWNNFDEEFISSIVYNDKTKKELKPSRKTDDKDMLIPTMEKIAPYPTKEFVITYRVDIEFKLLTKQPELVEKIYKNQTSSKSTNYRSMLNELSKMRLGATLLGSYISALCEIGSGDYEYEEQSRFAQPITIDLTTSIANDVPLYDFQKDAVQKLNDNLIANNNASGMLVMPTGSGKTRTATYFLLKNMISKGYQVVWLTHRHMLIDQTAESFYNFAPLVKILNPKAKILKMASISGEHSTIKATEKDDNVMVISVQSVCRSLDYLKTVLAKKVIIVVDEAHHTVAMSYRKTIDYIRKIRKDAKLLGLTATPVRGTDIESKYLLQLFENNIIFDISMSELITKQILANPNFERIETNTDFETIISIDEAKLIKKYGEIPPTLADKIAHSSRRNKAIVDTYMKNRERYGKTIMFALNAFHCYTLCQELKNKGVSCDYIYSGNKDNGAKIRRFKDNEFEVLININILTEGSDVPDIQTVFLTRPTQSEGLLMQMIGRGMRGKLAGGTETVTIVDFCDKWDTFNKWLNPEWLIGPVDVPTDVVIEYEPVKKIIIPWGLIGEIYKGISFKGDNAVARSLALPVGWYPLLDEDGNDYTMFVWKEQLKGFENIVKDSKEIVENTSITLEDVINKYFPGFEMPPSKNDVDLFLNNLINNDTEPRMFSFENRENIDPTILGPLFKEQNIGIGDLEDKTQEIFDANEDMIKNIYGDFENYYSRIIDCIKYQGGRILSDATITEIAVELLPYKIEQTYNLNELVNEVINEMFGGEYEGIESVEWTDKPYSSFYGKYFIGGIIRINKLLDSPQVDKEVVKFVIYHELLHRDYFKHDKAFYAQEHKYPDYTEHNRFLDYEIGNYKLEM